MREIVEKSDRLLQGIPMEFKRKVPGNLDWNWRLNAIVGARGTGKSTLLRQRAKILKEKGEEVLYVSLDDLYFTENRLIEVVRDFDLRGGKFLFVDEVHKYPGWARELKNIYDTYPELILAFSGSSIIQIFRQDVDLSRRALVYELPGLSFREYLVFIHQGVFEPIELSELICNHREIAEEIISSLQPIAHFRNYFQEGYYPFFIEPFRDYQLTLEQIVQLVIESDLQFMDGYDPAYSRKLLQLLRILSGSVPFKPNISKLSERIGISRQTLLNYLNLLEKARLISLLHFPDTSLSAFRKPEKIYLQNPNLFVALNPSQSSIGSMRETFFNSQMEVIAEVFLHDTADFLVNQKGSEWVFEVGEEIKAQSRLKE